MRMGIALLSTLVWLVAAAAGHAQSLGTVKPEQVGLSSERLGRIVSTLKADADKGTIPGAVLLVARHGKIAVFEAVGRRDPQTKAPMTRDGIFRIYSMTKPITSVAGMILLEEGQLSLADPVAKYIPAFREVKVGVEKPDPSGGQPALELVAPRRAMTVQDLYRHTSGLTYGIFGTGLVKKQYADAKLLEDVSNAEFTERLARLPLAHHPGAAWEYSHSTDVLGRVVEVVSGKSLYEFMSQRILEPLGMKDTAFHVADPRKSDRIVEPFADDRSIGANTTFFDPRVPQKWESGGGGMVGTTMDYARFLQMLLNGGTLDGRRILGPKTVAYMTADHLDGSIGKPVPYLPGAGFGFGLGFAVRTEPGVSAFPGTAGEYNWGGAGGTYFWVDPREDMFVIFMMQSPKQRVYYRALLKDMVYAAVTPTAAKNGQGRR